MEAALSLLKIDIGISHTHRDEYFTSLLNGCNKELSDKGVSLDLDSAEDLMLLVDYSAWRYRKRMEDLSLPQNLRIRIINAKTRRRAADA